MLGGRGSSFSYSKALRHALGCVSSPMHSPAGAVCLKLPHPASQMQEILRVYRSARPTANCLAVTGSSRVGRHRERAAMGDETAQLTSAASPADRLMEPEKRLETAEDMFDRFVTSDHKLLTEEIFHTMWFAILLSSLCLSLAVCA